MKVSTPDATSGGNSAPAPPDGVRHHYEVFAAWDSLSAGDRGAILTTDDVAALAASWADLISGSPDTFIVGDVAGGDCAVAWALTGRRPAETARDL